MHKRTLIRKTIRDMLMNATDCGERVYTSRTKPFIDQEEWQSELPAIVVYTSSESVSRLDEAPVRYERVLRVSVEIHAASDAEVDDFLDSISEQVENLVGLYQWRKLDMQMDLAETQMAVVDNGPSRINGAAAINFQIRYHSSLPGPEQAAALEDFKVSMHTFKVGEAQSQQQVNLP